MITPTSRRSAADIFHSSDDLPTKEAALRVLSTDPGSQDLFGSG